MAEAKKHEDLEKAGAFAKGKKDAEEKARATLDEKLNQAHEEADKKTKALEKALAEAQLHQAKEDAALAELNTLEKKKESEQLKQAKASAGRDAEANTEKEKEKEEEVDSDDDLPSWARVQQKPYDKDLQTFAQANADATAKAEKVAKDQQQRQQQQQQQQQESKGLGWDAESEADEAEVDSVDDDDDDSSDDEPSWAKTSTASTVDMSPGNMTMPAEGIPQSVSEMEEENVTDFLYRLQQPGLDITGNKGTSRKSRCLRLNSRGFLFYYSRSLTRMSILGTGAYGDCLVRGSIVYVDFCQRIDSLRLMFVRGSIVYVDV